MIPVGSAWRIVDPGAVWDRGHVVTVMGHYEGWPIVSGSGEDRVINPDRLKPAKQQRKQQQTTDRQQQSLL